jgi:predicted transcriptional regulator
VPPTTIKLPPELKERIEAVVRETGQSAHAFMLEAIERETRLAEQRQSFVEAALEARAEFARTGAGYDAHEVHAYFAARARGKRATRPKVKLWPR